MKELVDGKRLPKGTTHVTSITVDGIDTTPQKLNKLRSYDAMVLQIPVNLGSLASVVLQLLFSCFEKQGNVSEGLIGDLMWGFAQVEPPMPPEATFRGLAELHRRGYIKFQAPDNSYVSPQSDKIEKSWVRYQPKLLDMIYTDYRYEVRD